MRRALSLVVLVTFLTLGNAQAREETDPIVGEALRSKSFVLAEFVAESCPACEEMRPTIEAVLARYPEVRHQIHDADLELELARKYQVRCVPVYVIVDPEGQVRFNDVGILTEDQLVQILQRAGLRDR